MNIKIIGKTWIQSVAINCREKREQEDKVLD